MKQIIMIVGLLFSTMAYAGDQSITIQGGWQHTANSNYGDSGEFAGRYQHSIGNNFDGLIEGSYHGNTDHYGYGDLSGYDILGGLIYNLPIFQNFSPYIMGGIGWSWWNFDRNEDMKNAGIIIKTGNSFCEKFGIGADYPLGHNWSINIEWSYFRTDVPKKSYYKNTGSFANVAGGDTIGQEEINLMVGVKKRF